MLLSALAKEAAEYVVELRGDCEIASLFMDSRKNVDRGLFFCIPGARFDAHKYAPQAVSNGAAALVVTHFLDIDVPQLCVNNVRDAMSPIAAAFFGHPEKELTLLGITGTKGKTTTSYLVKGIFEKAGMKTGLIGTTGNMIGSEYLESEFTTPEPIDFFATLRLMADAGVQVVCMEVSAHALAMGRLRGVHFKVGCYTNLSQDHLDYFGDLENYFNCKMSFFSSQWLENGVVNADDERGSRVAEHMNGNVSYISYGICNNSDLFARNIDITEDGVNFDMSLRKLWNIKVCLRLTGMFNVYNALAAASVALVAGIEPETVREGLENVASVPGRAEVLDTHTPYKVVLDYSHSPDALQNILKTLKSFARGRVICIFGCGGDRDQLKRPIMGEISGNLADYTIITSDNPRSEDPSDIIRAIEKGIEKTPGAYEIVENRREAIARGLRIGQEGDIILLAGKGHETYQEINGIKNPFNEKDIVARLLMEMKVSGTGDK